MSLPEPARRDTRLDPYIDAYAERTHGLTVSAVRALFAVAATTELAMLVASTGPIKTLLGISGLDRVAAVVTME